MINKQIKNPNWNVNLDNIYASHSRQQPHKTENWSWINLPGMISWVYLGGALTLDNNVKQAEPSWAQLL